MFVPPSPKPSWFDDLNSKLDVAKTHAQDWIDNIGPSVTGGVPVQVINYGTTYSAITGTIQSIVNAHPDAQGADNQYVKQVHELVAALEQSVQVIVTNANTTQTLMKNWGDLMQASHDALTSSAVSIQKAEADLSADISKMNEAIKVLNDTIHNENIAIAASAGGIAIGLLLLVVGIALAPERAAPASLSPAPAVAGRRRRRRGALCRARSTSSSTRSPRTRRSSTTTSAKWSPCRGNT